MKGIKDLTFEKSSNDLADGMSDDSPCPGCEVNNENSALYFGQNKALFFPLDFKRYT